MSRAQYNWDRNGDDCCHMLEPCWYHAEPLRVRQVPDACVHCGGSGILNVEERHERTYVDSELVKVEWINRASACHACPEGELWEELLG